jgi:hypothetical protein
MSIPFGCARPGEADEDAADEGFPSSLPFVREDVFEPGSEMPLVEVLRPTPQALREAQLFGEFAPCFLPGNVIIAEKVERDILQAAQLKAMSSQRVLAVVAYSI